MKIQTEVLELKREVEMKTALLDMAVANNNLNEAYEIEKEINDLNRSIEQTEEQPVHSVKAEMIEVQKEIPFVQQADDLPSIEKQLEYMKPLSKIDGNDLFKAIYNSLEKLYFIENNRVIGDSLSAMLKDVQRPYSISRQRKFLQNILNVLMMDQEDLIKMMYAIDDTLCMGEFVAQATAERLLELPSNRPEVWNEEVAPEGTLITLNLDGEQVDGKIICYTQGKPSIETYDGLQFFAIDPLLLERREVING